MTRLAYCLPAIIKRASRQQKYPGLPRFLQIFDLYGHWVLPVDRTSTVTFPIRTISHFPIPRFRTFTKSYEDICDDRAVHILKKVDELGVTMYILYSGGIDSTCVMVSLLKHATRAQRENLVVLLSHESIIENPRFYEDHIKGKLRTGSSITYPNLIGEDVYLLSAEHNDLIFGSDKIGKMIANFGQASVHRPYDRQLITRLYSEQLNDDLAAASYHVGLFEKIRATSPVPIETNMDFLWWTNFAIKWHACYYYMLLFTPPGNAHKVTRDYLDSRFISFYNTDDFQLWSMNNLDKRIKDTWKTYKWPCKDIIYEYTKDADYRDHKTKKGSLLSLTGFNPPHYFIDEGLRFATTLDPDSYLTPNNDYIAV
ncbi:MAG: hypothetical protein RLZZ416_800 [Candidatus Parcubacteria bacterium]|jgi:hypothetical protein